MGFEVVQLKKKWFNKFVTRIKLDFFFLSIQIFQVYCNGLNLTDTITLHLTNYF